MCFSLLVKKNPEHVTLITRSQLCRRWSVSRATLRRREIEGLLAPVMVGPSVRYRLTDVENIEWGSRATKAGEETSTNGGAPCQADNMGGGETASRQPAPEHGGTKETSTLSNARYGTAQKVMPADGQN
jgi:hypothetical protein